MEIVDVDVTTRTISGKAFSHVYAGQRGLFDLQVVQSTPVARSSGDTQVSPMIEMDWFGQPGKSLGGFDSTVATIVCCQVMRSSDPTPPMEKTVSRRAANSTRSKNLACHKAAQSHFLQMERPTAGGIGFLAGHYGLWCHRFAGGSVANPLDVELINGSLFYRGRFYSLPLRIRPSERVSFSVNVVPKDLTRKLQRRFSVGGEERGFTVGPKRLLRFEAAH